MPIVHTLDPKYHALLPFVKNIITHFEEDAPTIHNARNVLKIFEHNQTTMVVKSFKKPNMVNQLVYSCFRPSKAARSYIYSQKLRALGIATPHPIAFVEERHWGLFQRSYYVSEHYNFDFEIRDVLNNTNFDRREEIFHAFARFSYQLHEAGVYHVDYSPGNVLIKYEQGGYDFNIVDVNRMEFITFNDTLRLKNLSRFSASEADTRMIATYYAEIAGLDVNWSCDTLAYYHQKHQEYRRRKQELKKLKKR